MQQTMIPKHLQHQHMNTERGSAVFNSDANSTEIKFVCISTCAEVYKKLKKAQDSYYVKIQLDEIAS